MPIRKDDPFAGLADFSEKPIEQCTSPGITLEGIQQTILDLMNRPITPRYHVNWRCNKCRQAGFATDVDSVKNYHPTVCKRKAKADDIFVWPRGL